MTQPAFSKHLTDRETEVFDCIQHGMLSKQIAAKLGISKRTVDAYRRNILQKCDAKNFKQLGVI